ncbi:L-type lectin-domain containing receptor kinase IV.1-like [Papaver somniferum]|uniref:L-type lectin-domain containing receptor kinase IV.1-like n=1 Tax=Papaver somniferum TaxID=3469 RepID=UPI000E6FFF2A|nr:L-type lectin-domain containing receptor kinase IV.1-like [Papaver somniferum]
MFFFKLLSVSLFFFFFFFFIFFFSATSEDLGFDYNGFRNAQNLSLNDTADITPGGLLRLTNTDSNHQIGHCFYSDPVQFYSNSSPAANMGNTTPIFSFSTSFVFAIVSESNINGQGLAFVIAPHRGLPGALPNQFLGLFNDSNNGKYENHVFAVELDTINNIEYDMDNNHVGIDVNGLKSVKAESAKYYNDKNGGYKNLILKNGKIIQVWVEYDGSEKQVNVTIAPIEERKPSVPLLSLHLDLSNIFLNLMYVGFSSSTQTVETFHYILGWSFKINGVAQEFNLSSLPGLPKPMEKAMMLTIVLSISIPITLIITICLGIFFFLRKRKFAELVEDWEEIYGTHRFSFKELYKAADGFGEAEIIGRGAFGEVYRGVLSNPRKEVAIKKVMHDSRQGMQQFIAEIVSIGKLRHRNLVQLYGYCRRRGELLLVYEFLPCGSLEKFIFPSSSSASSSSSARATLDWCQRFKIIKGVASGLVYLHEEWEKVVIHRDVKASNVLLNAGMEPKLGDFGLAVLFDHGTGDALTSRIAGTPGYIAPEMNRSGLASTCTDVYAFGVFLLEVVCGKRPVQIRTDATGVRSIYLVDLVLSCWKNGTIRETADPSFGSEYVAEEIELVLKLGLLCTHTNSDFRPTMRQVVQYLNGDAALLQTDLWVLDTSDTLSKAFSRVNMGDLYPCSAGSTFSASSSTPNESVPSGPR